MGETPSAVIRRAMATAPSSFFPDSYPDSHLYTDHSLSQVGDVVLCPVCTAVLERPIELACDRMVCLGCLVIWVQISPKLTCPCCFDNPLNSDHMKSPSAITIRVLGSLLVVCGICKRSVQAGQYLSHISTKCSAHSVDSPSKATIRDILSKSPDSAPSPVERRVAGSVIKRMMAGNEGLVQVPTGSHGNNNTLSYIMYNSTFNSHLP